MSEELILTFDDEGKAHAINEDYAIYCADEETFEKVKEAVEKQKKKKVHCTNVLLRKKITYEFCPNCGRFLEDKTLYCGNCGQALDWEVRK